jgi:hypothetical protein
MAMSHTLISAPTLLFELIPKDDGDPRSRQMKDRTINFRFLLLSLGWTEVSRVRSTVRSVRKEKDGIKGCSETDR